MAPQVRDLPVFVIVSQQCEKGRVVNGTSSNDAAQARGFVGVRFKAIVAGLATFILLGVGSWVVHLGYRNLLLIEARGDVMKELDPYANALTIDLRRRIDIIYGLAAWVTTTNSLAELDEKFVSFARQLTENVAGVRALAVAPEGVVRLVFPRAGNEAALERNNLKDSRDQVRADIVEAIQSRKVVISGPHEMAVGGLGVVARMAIFRRESFWGLVHVALDIPPVLAEAKITAQQNLQWALRDGRGRVFVGSPAVFDSSPVFHPVQLPDGHWDLAAIPKLGWNGAIRRDLIIFDVAMLTTALLLSAITYLLAFRGARLALRVEEATGELTAELERRTVMETELWAAEERYKTLVELNPDAVIVIADKQIVYANRAALRLFGAQTLHDFLGRSAFDLIHPADRAEAELRQQRIVESGAAIVPTIQRRLRLDGSPIYVEIVAAPVAWEGGTAVQVILRDLSEQRKVERSLRGLIDAMQDAVICIDRQAQIVMFNIAAERIFGYTRAEVEGKKINMLMPEPYASEHDGYISRYESTGEARAIGRIRTVSGLRKNGERFPVELSVTQISSGDDVSYTAFIRDISEKVKLQEQAIENERLITIGTMAAKFGHELGNPLNGMSLTIQLLEQRLRRQTTELDEQIVTILTRLKSEISRLNSLLQDFRSLSRKESYNFQPASLSWLVTEAIAMELPRYAEQGIEVEFEFAADLPTLSIDVDKMKQVILNLAKNAADAMPSGGKLKLTGSATASGVTLEISDTGIGIGRDTDIFEPFFTTKSFGTGIGLTIVRQIVLAHGGTIAYRSEAGQGTSFFVHLPLSLPGQVE